MHVLGLAWHGLHTGSETPHLCVLAAQFANVDAKRLELTDHSKLQPIVFWIHAVDFHVPASSLFFFSSFRHTCQAPKGPPPHPPHNANRLGKTRTACACCVLCVANTNKRECVRVCVWETEEQFLSRLPLKKKAVRVFVCGRCVGVCGRAGQPDAAIFPQNATHNSHLTNRESPNSPTDLCVCVCVCLCLSVCVSVCVSLSQSLSLDLSLSRPLSLSTSLSVSLSTSLSLSPHAHTHLLFVSMQGVVQFKPHIKHLVKTET